MIKCRDNERLSKFFLRFSIDESSVIKAIWVAWTRGTVVISARVLFIARGDCRLLYSMIDGFCAQPIRTALAGNPARDKSLPRLRQRALEMERATHADRVGYGASPAA